MVTFTLNGRPHEVDVPDDTPLLWALRETLHGEFAERHCTNARAPIYHGEE